MTTKEFITDECNSVIEDIHRYGVNREGGRRYIVEPFPSKEDFLDLFEHLINDPYEDLSDDGFYDGIENDIQECREQIERAYDVILGKRLSFLSLLDRVREKQSIF